MADDDSPVFLTGATGFVGPAILRRLLAGKREVRAVVRNAKGLAEHPRLKVIAGSITEAGTWAAAVEGCGAAIHLVGIIDEKRDTFENVHTVGTRNVVEALKRAGTVRKYVHMSALGTRRGAVSRYHQSKYAGEEIVRGSGLDFTIFRPSLIFGKGGEFTEMLRMWSWGKAPPYLFMPFFGSGFWGQSNPHRIQPIHVEDVAEIFVDALTNAAARKRSYDIAGPERFTWREMLGVASARFRGRRKAVVGIPAWYGKFLASLPLPLPFNKDQVQMSQEDNTADVGAMEADFPQVRLRKFSESLEG